MSGVFGGGNREAVARGEEQFNDLGCRSCHPQPFFTDRQIHDVGTGDPAKERNSHGRGTRFDTPSLRALWLTAPYFHDGSAASLAEVLRTGTVHDIAGDVTEEEIENLLAYLLALPIEP